MLFRSVADCISVDIYLPPSSYLLLSQEENDVNSNTNESTKFDKGIMVEVNGPSHFLQVEPSGSNTFCPTVKTLKKQQLLEKMGYLYIEVPYYEWHKIRNDDSKKKVYLKTKFQKLLSE